MNGLYESFTLKLVNINDLTRERFIDETGSYTYWNMFIIYKGSFLFGTENQIARKGDVVIFPPKEIFHRKVLEPLSFLSVHFEWESITESSNPYNPQFPHGVIKFKDSNRIVSTALRMKDLSDHPLKSIIGSHLLTDIWYQYALESEVANTAFASSNIYVSSALHIIDLNLSEELKISDLADMLHISQVHLIHLFKRYMGMTPSEYIISKRLQKAKNLLTDTQLSMQQIAEHCGFTNSYYFSTRFKSETGMPPSHFRMLYQI